MCSRRVDPRALACAAVLILAACSTDGSARPAGDSIETGQHVLPPVAAPIAQVDSAYSLASKIALPPTKPEDAHGLHNLFRLSPNVISGAEPSTDESFEQLAAMGVKTVISVDGKKPELELAQKHGMRYIHIPIEYKGISDEELLQIVKTYRECEGPFYAHCFHGKHRGPAAAAIGRLVLDGASREEAIAEMRQWCGTAPEYEGLYRDVATKLIPSEQATQAYVFDFPSSRSFGGFRDAMIDVSRREDRLKKAAARDWANDPAHPDIEIVHEAATLADTLRIAGTLAEIYDRPSDFHDWLKQAAEQSLELENQLTAARQGEAGAPAAASKAWTELSKTCTACHTAYRNR